MIELVDVSLDHPRGGSPLVSAANLKAAPGEVVVVVGAAGVGTSRMVAAALGEVQARAGRIEVLGRDVAKLRRSSLRLLRRRVGIVPQDLCLLEDRSAQLNVALPLEIDGIPRSVSIARATDALGKLGLESEASLPVELLSSAERQRVAVARALVRDPELILADHPTSAQDRRRPRDAVDLERQHDVELRAAIVEQAQVLGHDADPPAQQAQRRAPQLADVAAEQLDAAGARRHLAERRGDGARRADAGRADDQHDLTLADLQARARQQRLATARVVELNIDQLDHRLLR